MGAHKGSAADAIAVLAVNVGAATSTPLASTAVKLDKADKVSFLFGTGDMAAETIDFKLQACDVGGGNPVDIPGKAITQLAGHASNNDNKAFVVAVTEDDVAALSRLAVRGLATTGGVTGGQVVIAALATFFSGLAADADGAAVIQIVP
jgi:hypothetical protein